MDSKDLDETMASARQTTAQVESTLKESREQLARQAELLGDYAITGEANSGARDESFRQAYTRERQAALTSDQLPIRGSRVKLIRQMV
ncbi:hypothetical protein NKJ88_31445 [Mesorhizobium sp. M0016]|uniref:hypothetical protein n=1 Tax=Mesorhizobium sp. M0016 TaxID=2956843 RepID=UPI00333D2D03